MTAAYSFAYDYTRRSSLLRNSRAFDAIAFEDQGGNWFIAAATAGSIDLYQLGATPDYNNFDSASRQTLNLSVTNTHAIQHHWDGTNNYLIVACAGNDRIAVVQLASTVDFANFSTASIAYRTGIDDCRYIEILDDGTSIYCFTNAQDTGEIVAIDLGGGSTTIDFANVSTASLASNTFSAAGAFECGNIFDDGSNLYLCFGTISNDRLHIAPIGTSPTFDFANYSTATSKSQAIPFPIGAKIFDDGTNIYVCCGDFDNEAVRWLQVGTTSIDYANYGTFSSNTLAVTGSNPTWLDFLDDGNRRYLVVSTSSSSGSLTFHFFPLGATVPFASLSSLEEYVISAADRTNLGRFALIDGNYYFLAPTQTDMRVYPFGIPAYSQTLTNQINFGSTLVFSGPTATLTGTTAKTYFQFDAGVAPTNDPPPGLNTTFSFTRDTESSGTINSGTLIFDQSGHDLTASEGITVASGGAFRLGKKAGPYTLDLTFQDGSTLEVYPDSDRGGSTLNLTNHTFSATTTINVTSGTATVLVPAGQAANITAGSGVTVNQVEVSFVAENFADGVRYYLAHQQVFTVAAANVTTAANTITLGNDSNGDAPDFASSSPYTLVRIDKTEGATLPTTSPQIIDGGRYYATISGSAITLFVTEADISGTPITISTAGTDSGGSIFTLTAETELANGVVSGGSGLSVSLSLSNEARVLRKAGQWDNSGTVTATPLYQQIFSWSTASGIADPQAISVATEVDETHDRIIGLSNIELEGPIENASGTFITSINPASDGSSLDTSNSGPYSFALEGRGRIQINANDSDGISNWQDLYIWGVWVSFTEMGIRLVEPTTFSAVDVFNFRFANIEFDNTSSTTLFIVGGNGRSSDGSNFVASTTTGSIVPNALAQGTGAQTETAVSGLTSAESLTLSKVDKLAARVGIGTAATISSTAVSTGDSSLTQTITDNGDGSYTVEES